MEHCCIRDHHGNGVVFVVTSTMVVALGVSALTIAVAVVVLLSVLI